MPSRSRQTPRATKLVRGVCLSVARTTLGLAAALAVVSCRGAPRVADAPLPTLTSVGGPENVLLRIPRNGGLPRSYRWPGIDAPIWTGTEKLPAIDRVLAFDDGGGLLALTTKDGRAGRLDLRTGRAQFSADTLTSATSTDGWSIYGINPEGRFVRLTPTAEWRGPIARADSVIALTAGNVALADYEQDRTRVVRFRPPAITPMDTLDIVAVDMFARSPGGDRLYGRTNRGMVTLDTREWRLVVGPRTSRPPLAIVTTPSGDRALILDADGRTIRVWRRYAERFDAPIKLDTLATDLRMDPLGRFVLARMEFADSIIVVSVPTGRVVRTVPSQWRADLPALTPNGQLLTYRADEVLVLDPVAAGRRIRIRGGALDHWVVIRWDGFRPRDSSLDAPATFETDAWAAASTESIDSLLAANAALAAAEREDSIRRAGTVATGRGSADSAAATGFTLQFAALFSETAARGLAEKIRVDGRPPRVVAGSRDGVAIYRVVLGPYPTREAAEAAGRRSGQPYFIYPGLP